MSIPARQALEEAIGHLQDASRAAERGLAAVGGKTDVGVDVTAVVQACDQAVILATRAAKRIEVDALKADEARIVAARQQAEADLAKL